MATRVSAWRGRVARQCLSLSTWTRSLASGRSETFSVFDRSAKLMQRERAAARDDIQLYDYLKEEVGYRLSERIFDIKSDFKVGLDLGCGRGQLAKHISETSLEKLYMCDFSPGLLAVAESPKTEGLAVQKLCVDEESTLPFKDNELDIVLSNLSLHWVNKLPSCLREVQRTLKRDGVLLAAMLGGDTLYQLRSALLLAEMEREGGVSAHISPFTETQDVGTLLTNAGFTLLTVDTEDITVGYPSMWELMWDLQGMAENNANISRKLHLSRDTAMAAAAIYQEMYGDEQGIPATYQIIYMIGWKPNPERKAEPAARGSGQISMKDINRLEELIREKGVDGKLKFMRELEDAGKSGDDHKKK